MAMPSSDDVNLHDVEDYDSEVSHDQLPSVEEARSSMGVTKHSSSSSSSSSTKRILKALGACTVFILVIVAIAVPASNKKKGGARIPRNTEKAIHQFALNGKDDFDDESSYQFFAKRLLLEDDLVDKYTYDQLQQRYAMYCLHHATNPSGWIDASGWKRKGMPECDWFGVSCHPDMPGMVSRIELRGNGLGGHIPPEVSLIPELMVFNVNANDLEGEVPSHICQLLNERDLTVKVDCSEVVCECCDNCAPPSTSTNSVTEFNDGSD